jgi:hypothetical protein
MSGVVGLPPRVGVVRQTVAPPSLEERVRKLLVGRRINSIDYDAHTLVLHLDSGESFVMQNSGGFSEQV